MMKKQMQKAVCLLLGSVLLLSMGACGKKDKTSARDVTDGSSATATQTTQVVREIKSHKGEIGEEMQYQDVDAVMKKAYVSDYTFSENGSEIGLTFFEFEITNNSEDELAVDLLSQTFGLTVDGEAYPGVSIRSPRFIYKEFGDSGRTFDTAIQPGETRDGYICMEVPADFQSLRITYFPRAGFLDWDEAFLFDIDRSDMEAAPEPVEAFQ